MSNEPLSPDPPRLIGCDWVIEDIVGRPILPDTPAMFRLDEGGRVSGRTGCNHFTGAAEVEGGSLRFGKLALTRMLCPPPVMDQEQRLLQALEATRTFTIDADGRLHLQGKFEPFLLRAKPRRGLAREG
ncbi:MAG: META domain-containing protein [Myxococcota bacterium]